MSLSAAEREQRLAELLGENTHRAMAAFREAGHAWADDVTNHTLIDVYFDRMEDLFCEHINHTISLSGNFARIFDERQTADEERIGDLEEQRELDAHEANT